MVVGSNRLAFILPQDKKTKFQTLHYDILSKPQIDLKSLQRFAGKCTSLMVAIPGALLYTREVNNAISRAQKNGKLVDVEGELKEEIEQWCFLEEWEGYAPWRRECHIQVKMATDASTYAWARTVIEGTHKSEIRDYWPKDDNRPIHMKELDAVVSTLRTLSAVVKNARVDLSIDNKAVLHAWKGQGFKNISLSRALKSLFQVVAGLNIDLKMEYISSSMNPADAPSRKVSAQDAKLHETHWECLEDRWGPHTCDLMTLDSNAMLGSGGTPLRHFTPFPTPESAGTNIFCQDVQLEINPYVFPPIALIPAVLAYLKEKHVMNCTVVLPVTRLPPSWYTMVLHSKQDAFLMARKGDTGVLWYPSKRGWVLDRCSLQWDLWAFRLQPWENSSSQNNVCDSGNKHQI